MDTHNSVVMAGGKGGGRGLGGGGQSGGMGNGDICNNVNNENKVKR